MKAFMSQMEQVNGLNDFLEIFSNVDTMKQYYPKTYEAYNNTLEGKVVQNNQEGEAYVEVNILNIGYSDLEKKLIVVDVASDASDQNGYCVLKPSLKTWSGEEVEFTADGEFLGNSQSSSIYIPVEKLQSNELSYELSVNVYCVDEQISKYSCSINLEPYILDYECEFIVEHPSIQRKMLEGAFVNDEINIAYLFKIGGVDYFYSRNDMADRYLRIPSKGQIKVTGLNMTSIQSVTLSAANTRHIERFHTNAAATLQDSSTIVWDIPDNWGVPYMDILDNVYEYIEYKLSISANCQGRLATFYVTNSQQSEDEGNKYPIKKINIYRDCFVEKTKLQMADGSLKAVEDLQEGDLLSSIENSDAKISKIERQTSEQMIAHIVMEDGSEIEVTQYHPFVTENGLKCAVYLENGDTLVMDNGTCKIKQICVSPAEEIETFAIILNDSKKRIYANGFLTADSVAELSEAEKESKQRNMVPEEWRADYDGWMARNRGELL